MTKTKEKYIPFLEKNWEIKDRHYFLTGNYKPLTLTIPSRHTRKHPLLWFDEELSSQRELRYATNQDSVFVDEQKGEATMGHITFHDGVMHVPKQQQNLQKMLSLYHPLKGLKYREHDAVEVAEDELVNLELEILALNAAKAMEIEHAEAILRVEKGTKVSEMESKEIKRDILLVAKNNPKLFIELAKDDNVQLRNFGIKATEANIIYLSQDQRSFHWTTNDKKLMTIPFDENPYAAFAAYLKTDEGVDVYKSIQKKMK